jgi:hypothetical protein
MIGEETPTEVLRGKTAAQFNGQSGTSPSQSAVRLAWFNPDGSEAFHVDVQAALFALIKQAAKKQGVGLQEWFETAVREKIARGKSLPALAEGGAR